MRTLTSQRISPLPLWIVRKPIPLNTFRLVFSLRKYRLTHLMLIKSTLYNNKKYHKTNNYTYIIGP